jgi:hypothetical protein
VVQALIFAFADDFMGAVKVEGKALADGWKAAPVDPDDHTRTRRVSTAAATDIFIPLVTG